MDGSPCDTLGIDNLPLAKFRHYQDSSDYLAFYFTDLSTYEPTEWSWDFGDGSTSQDTSPVHTYTQGGAYEVCLTVSNQYGSDTFCRSLDIATGTEGGDLPAAALSVFPNPAKGGTTLFLNGYQPRRTMLRLYDSMGNVRLSQRIMEGWNGLDLEGLPPGVYLYEVRDGERRIGAGKLVRVE